jgi:hypothetical protein
MLGWWWRSEPAEAMGYLPKGLSDFLRGSPGLRAFLDMETLSGQEDDTEQPSSNSSAEQQKRRIHNLDGLSNRSDGE